MTMIAFLFIVTGCLIYILASYIWKKYVCCRIVYPMMPRYGMDIVGHAMDTAGTGCFLVKNEVLDSI